MRKERVNWKEICVNLFILAMLLLVTMSFDIDYEYVLVRKNLNAEICIGIIVRAE